MYNFPTSPTAHSQLHTELSQVGTYREFVFFDERQVMVSKDPGWNPVVTGILGRGTPPNVFHHVDSRVEAMFQKMAWTLEIFTPWFLFLKRSITQVASGNLEKMIKVSTFETFLNCGFN